MIEGHEEGRRRFPSKLSCRICRRRRSSRLHPNTLCNGPVNAIQRLMRCKATVIAMVFMRAGFIGEHVVFG